MSRDQVGAYQRVQKLGLPQREAEAMAFTKAARMLEQAMESPVNSEAYARALKFNRLLWTIVQAELTEDKGRLPDDLKADILSLSIFVDKQTLMAQAKPEAAYLKPLFAINRNIAGGLLANGEARPLA